MKVKLTDLFGNLCETCMNDFATCCGIVEYGKGYGSDNIVECDCYEGPWPEDAE